MHGATRGQGAAAWTSRHDLDAMAAAVTPRTKMVIVCNPNNPTGTYVPVADIARLVEAVPGRRAGRRRRGLQRVRHRTRQPGRAHDAGGARERGRAAHLLQDLRALRPARGLRPRPGGAASRHSTRCGSRSTSTAWRRPPRSRRSSTRTRSRGGGTRTPPARRHGRGRWRRAAAPRCRARPTSCLSTPATSVTRTTRSAASCSLWAPSCVTATPSAAPGGPGSAWVHESEIDFFLRHLASLEVEAPRDVQGRQS